MKYNNFQNTLTLHTIYAGYYEAGKEWCYQNVISPFTRLFLFEKGKGYIYMNKKKYELKGGDLFIIPKFTFHSYECPEFLSQYYICFFDHQIGNSNIFEHTNITYKVQASESVKAQMKRFIKLNPGCNIQNPNPKSYDNKPELFNNNNKDKSVNIKKEIESNGILLQLFSQFITPDNLSSTSKDTYKNLTDVFNYIDFHLGENIRIADLAGIMCICKDHFTRIFKNINGMSPSQYIQLKRIERAQTLMLSSQLTINEIAEEVGIHNSSQFSKLFRKYVGISPTVYLKNEKVDVGKGLLCKGNSSFTNKGI